MMKENCFCSIYGRPPLIFCLKIVKRFTVYIYYLPSFNCVALGNSFGIKVVVTYERTQTDRPVNWKLRPQHSWGRVRQMKTVQLGRWELTIINSGILKSTSMKLIFYKTDYNDCNNNEKRII